MSAREKSTYPPQSNEIADLIRPLVPTEGPVQTPVPGGIFYRTDHTMPRTPVLYEPWLLFFIQGDKRGYIGNHVFDYGGLSHMAFSVPMPMEAEVLSASPELPFLCIGISIEPAEIGDLAVQSGLEVDPIAGSDHALFASPLSGEMLDTLTRLVRVMEDPAEARVLGPLIRREILFRVMAGEQGPALLSVIQRQGHLRRIGDVMRHVNDDCAAPITTAEMSRIAGMSKTTLHESFKSITSLTPLQYVKSIRLHQARNLMLNQGLPASTAGYRVGYASASQFSREFKRFFGVPPSHIARMEAAPGSP